MSNFDYFKQYQSEMKRIQDKIREEENPIHREHLVQIEQMIDDKIKSAVPMYMQDYNDKQRINVEACAVPEICFFHSRQFPDGRGAGNASVGDFSYFAGRRYCAGRGHVL